MAISIGVPDTASSTQTITFSKKSYTIDFKYNSRFDFWTFSLYDSAGNPIILGEKVMPDKEYLRRYAKVDLLGGYIFTTSLDNSPVTRNNFGLNKTHWLTYRSEEEVENARTV